MRLLVTRPQPDAEETAARLRQLGHEVRVASLLEIVFTPPPGTVAEPAAIVFTSRNGVRAFSAWPEAARWLDKPAFAVGSATVAAARSAGFRDIRVGNGDSGDLANFFMAHVDRSLRPILYPAARDRAGALSAGLRANGFDIVTVEAYRAEAVATLDAGVVAMLRTGAVDGILVYSRRTAEILAGLVERHDLAESVRTVPIFALAPRVVEPLRARFTDFFVAKQPNEAALFALLPVA